ncbi:hypothetical protein [Paenibacillus sp. Cedars]|uniref:hypothetical protein n=1 Tax=Paenibacillus sp. Cedars TaxID=1980674 RepID=UPI001162A371|nr:hypothetical protein [Paenibacillus sp. Cedars]AWP30083.1 hypothetical protein B9D94_27240 [Paenibacillus sp. Cedars]
MKVKLIISLLVLLFVFSIFIQFFILENKPIETKIVEQLTIQDNTFKELVHYDMKNNNIYAFYTNTVYNTYPGLGLGVLENNRKMKTHIVGGIPIDSDKGFTYEVAESKQFSVVYGTITNHQITTIEVNGQKGNLVREGDLVLWYYIWGDNPPLSLSIQAKEQTGKVLFDEKLF